ncbi:SDR family oxidoreductase [Chitinophaga pendula]|uniref:SDR family oxidoreductase n=1 Tax=Chitinophaga TaxID=79328 RepID=UPI000BAFB26C|nr:MULTISPECIES: SDR family oxidoreductase [Chitinophaga]ASZ13250.1 short-chain dehydrogenase [Chitinophaga sp. MD30]UCJ09129.1 SDR family oxidoreductase [Chitinophaga pendula]
MKRTILITGASSGLGKVTAKYFAGQGWNVAATMRSPENETDLTQYDNISIFRLDVTNPAQIREALHAAINTFGKIDVVLNNAGMGVYGALELASESDIDQQFTVNVRGVINVIRAVLPHFRANRNGKFINVSSFMGITTAVPLGSLYNMSKFALEGLTEGLYYELKPLNISLHLIEPGGFTGNNFTQNMIWNDNDEIIDYNSISQKVQHLFNTADRSQIDDVMVLVNNIEDIATGKNNQFRTVIGQAGNQLMNMRNSMPIEEYLDKIAASFS